MVVKAFGQCCGLLLLGFTRTLSDALLSHVSLQNHAEIIGSFIATWQACMELFESAPGDSSLDCCNSFAFFNQNSKGFTVKRVIGFELADR